MRIWNRDRPIKTVCRTSAWMHEVEQRRSSCRGRGTRARHGWRSFARLERREEVLNERCNRSKVSLDWASTLELSFIKYFFPLVRSPGFEAGEFSINLFKLSALKYLKSVQELQSPTGFNIHIMIHHGNR